MVCLASTVFLFSFSVARGHGNRAACLQGTSRKCSLELHFLQRILIRPQNSQFLRILQALPTLITLAFLYVFFIFFYAMISYKKDDGKGAASQKLFPSVEGGLSTKDSTGNYEAGRPPWPVKWKAALAPSWLLYCV